MAKNFGKGSKFRIGDTGFQIDLDSGYTVSVQFGKYHYCSSRHGEDTDFHYNLQCTNAEVAVFDRDGEFVNLDKHDDVLGWQSVSQVLAIIKKFNALDA